MLVVSSRLTRSSLLSAAGLYKTFEYATVRHKSTIKFFDRHIDRYDAAAIAAMKQGRNRDPKTGKTSHHHKKRRKVEHDSFWKEGSNEEVLAFEVAELLKRPRPSIEIEPGAGTAVNGEVGEKARNGDTGTLKGFHEIELEIEKQSSTGDGLARSALGDHVYVIPFSVPGDRVLANVRIDPTMTSSSGDFRKIIRPSTKRGNVKPGCKYFTECSGCQFQMLPYREQLAHKKSIVAKAFRHFSELASEQIPNIEETGPSPLQYAYRTKLTPHFDRPGAKGTGFKEVPPIGYTRKGFKSTIDIESCPIGTPIVQRGLEAERAKVAANISTYKNGATILVREDTKRVPNSGSSLETIKLNSSPPTILPDLPPALSTNYIPPPTGPRYVNHYPLPYHDIKTYTSDHNASTTEYISTSSLQFTTRAGSFFQNNNSILPSFLTHLRSVAIPPPSKSNPPLRYLLDAYCGSGLLALSLAPLFASVLGIEIDGSSIHAATHNAKLNNISNCGFIEADAADLFADVPFPPEQTVLVIDPPRKGCSVDFLKQMLKWGPRRVVYVSCNVHSQARDVGWMAKGAEGLENIGKSGKGSEKKGEERKEGWTYDIESLKGWDFFPQTGHVEGLCVLNRKENAETGKPVDGRSIDGHRERVLSAASKRDTAPSRSRSRSPKRQATSSSKEELSIWEEVKEEVEAELLTKK